MRRKALYPGFTLVEMLIALTILGVVATFTIPKIIQAQQDQQYNASAREAIGTISAAYIAYKQVNGGVSPTTMSPSSLIPYLNYVQLDSAGGTLIDGYQGNDWLWCLPTSPCVRLHNGGILYLDTNGNFNGSATTNAVTFDFDPDGRYANNLTGPGKSLEFVLYYNGRVTSRANCMAHSYNSSFADFGPVSTADPTWFRW